MRRHQDFFLFVLGILPIDISAQKKVEEALERAEITVNKNMVPFDTQSPFVTSGIRIGTPAMTTRGLGKADFEHIVQLIDTVLQNPESEDVQDKVAGEVRAMCERFPLYDFVTA